MEKIRWRKVLKLTIPLSIIAVITIVFTTNLGKVSKLSNGDFIGMRKTEFMDNKEVLFEVRGRKLLCNFNNLIIPVTRIETLNDIKEQVMRPQGDID